MPPKGDDAGKSVYQPQSHRELCEEIPGYERESRRRGNKCGGKGCAGKGCHLKQRKKELNNTSEEQIGFRGKRIGSFSLLNAKNEFERTDGTFNSGALSIQLGPSGRTAQNVWIETQISVRINVDTAIVKVASQGAAPS